MTDLISEAVISNLILLKDVFKDSKIPLNMGEYCTAYGHRENGFYEKDHKVVPACGTTVCLAGHIPFIQDEAVQDAVKQAIHNRNGNTNIDFRALSYGFLGTVDTTLMWDFLFSDMWAHSRGQALLRLEYVIKHRHIHPYFDIYLKKPFNFDLVLTEKDLI